MFGGLWIVNYFNHALSRVNSSTTLKFTGHVNDEAVQAFTENASTHNFILAKMQKYLQFKTELTRNFSMVVEKRNWLWCWGVGRKISMTIHGNKIVEDLYILSIHGANIVIGVSWFYTFEDVLLIMKTNYLNLL